MSTAMKIDIGISAKDREVIADGLSRLLADSYALYLQSHNFHWNVTGPMFQTLHVLFMEHYTEQWKAVDLNFPLRGWEQYDCVRKALGKGPAAGAGTATAARPGLNPVFEAIKGVLDE